MGWQTRPLDAAYLVDSGLLFEINRSVLHLFGIALTVQEGRLALKDSRSTPESCIFNKETLLKGRAKLQRFLKEFGHSQDERRCEILGYGCQGTWQCE